MPMEMRSFDDPILVTAVLRYTPAERSGLVPGDLILSFGARKTTDLKDEPELIQSIGAKDWLTILRGDVYFKLQPRDGLEGASFEAATALEQVNVPVEDGQWKHYASGTQADGILLLMPERISSLWAIAPVMLFMRYRLWQMLTGALLVYGVAAMMGLVPFILTYVVTALPVLTSGAYLIRSAAEKQGYAKRGEVMVANSRDAAALEIETTKRNREARKPPLPAPKTEAVLDNA